MLSRRSSTARRLGAMSLAAGLALSVGTVAFGSSVSGAATTTSNICNNQSGDPTTDCQGTSLHGSLTAEVQANGDVMFTFTGATGFGGWNEIKICTPQVGPTKGADCTGADPEIVSPTAYELSGETGAVETDKNVTFDCDTSFSALVDAAVFAGTTRPTYTVHLTPCAGGTDEAFGTADAFVAPTTTTTGAKTTTTGATTTTTTAPITTTTRATLTSSAPSGGTPAVAPAAQGNSDVGVLGEVVVRPAVAAAPLARTGYHTLPLVGLAVGLVLIGVGAVVLGRRPELQPVPVRARR